jgi:hypothetical protein
MALAPALALGQASSTPAAPAAPSAAGNSAAAAGKVAPGVIIPAELSKSIDAKKAKTGDKVEAKTAIDLLSHGQIVIPRNAKIEGHVTNAKAHSKQSPDSMVGIVFDKITTKDGRDLPLQAEVQAIGRPLQAAPSAYQPMAGGPSAPAPSAPSGSNGGMGSPSGSGSTPSSSYPSGASNMPEPPSQGYPQSGGAGGSSVSPLNPTSQGVVGIKGLSLSSSPQASIVSSGNRNVHLDSGTQLILRTQ